MNSEKNKRAFFLVVVAVITMTVTFLFSAMFFAWFYSPVNNSSVRFDPTQVSALALKKFEQVKNVIIDSFYKKVDQNTLLEGAVEGMAASLGDPYTVYFDKDKMKAFMERTEGNYVGIGAVLIMENDGIMTVVEPYEDSPAQKAGIIKGDRIIEVDGKDVTGIRDDVLIIKRIKGPENTKVKITIYRPSLKKQLSFEIIRKKIIISNVMSKMHKNKVGYIKIAMFDNDVYKEFEKHLQGLIDNGIKSLIIDVRDNPGGSYSQVVAIADRILPEATIVYTKNRTKRDDIQYSDDKKQLKMPVVILVNSRSASASEILAGSLKDNKKAVVIGTKTFGKGLVQAVLPLEDGSGLKITTSTYYTPSGKNINGKGISPDITLEVPEKYKENPVSQIPENEDNQLQKALSVAGGR